LKLEARPWLVSIQALRKNAFRPDRYRILSYGELGPTLWLPAIRCSDIIATLADITQRVGNLIAS